MKKERIEGLQDIRNVMKNGDWNKLQEMLMDDKYSKASNYIEAEKINRSYDNPEIKIVSAVAMQAIQDGNAYAEIMLILTEMVDRYVCSTQFWKEA